MSPPNTGISCEPPIRSRFVSFNSLLGGLAAPEIPRRPASTRRRRRMPLQVARGTPRLETCRLHNARCCRCRRPSSTRSRSRSTAGGRGAAELPRPAIDIPLASRAVRGAGRVREAQVPCMRQCSKGRRGSEWRAVRTCRRSETPRGFEYEARCAPEPQALRANIRETVDPFEISVQGGEAKAA
jgi:hypothetical protein